MKLKDFGFDILTEVTMKGAVIVMFMPEAHQHFCREKREREREREREKNK
jgi:hypothetical protein